MVVDVSMEVDFVEGVEGVEEFGAVNGADLLLQHSDQMQPFVLPLFEHLPRSEQVRNASMVFLQMYRLDVFFLLSSLFLIFGSLNRLCLC